jgi:16S rRNA (guanine(527)-N(7))-methyltransferase RsmG
VSEIETILKDEAGKIPLLLSEGIVHKIIRYDRLLQEWNRRFNLTGLNDARERIIWLYLESLWAASHLQKPDHVLDIGAGCGFPGMALQWWHGCRLTMLESRKKKCDFLQEAISHCDMSASEVKNIRYEGDLPGPVKKGGAEKLLYCWRAVSLGTKTIQRMTGSMRIGDEMLCFFGRESKDFPIVEKSPFLKVRLKKEFPLSKQRYILQMMKCST